MLKYIHYICYILYVCSFSYVRICSQVLTGVDFQLRPHCGHFPEHKPRARYMCMYYVAIIVNIKIPSIFAIYKKSNCLNMYKRTYACVQCQVIHAAYRSLPTGTRSSITQVNYSSGMKRKIASRIIIISYIYVVHFLLCRYVLVYDNGS